ncbi:hypothetical protein FAJ35_00290 [Streptococcus suis]|uniref:Uncharacterized protein n=1 Tax=Streptococcus suis TaxID=1307 RepID=A0A3R8R9D8_STRSU|nr:hypothetical protein EJA00_00245 [Streptococcus suis]TII04232.1 hypothetical protein FAJ35_00290 [Streptococcus suis]
MIRSDLECKTRINLPINHCAEMLTLTLRSGAGLFAQPLFPTSNTPLECLNSPCLIETVWGTVSSQCLETRKH